MKELRIITTNKCNLRCKHCGVEHDEKEIDVKVFEKIVKEAKELGYDTIGFTGGEPSQHSNFSRLIEITVENCLNFRISTNGVDVKDYTQLAEKYPKEFLNITFSLDGPNAKVHDEIRGKGTFDKTIDSIKEFQKLKIPVFVTVCINQDNKKMIDEFINIGSRLKINVLRFLTIIPTNEENKKIALSDKEKDKVVQDIEKYKYRTDLCFKYYILSSLYQRKGIEFCHVLNGLKSMTVTPNGDLLICCDVFDEEKNLGSLREFSLKQLTDVAKMTVKSITKIRQELIYANCEFEGFNTCNFCNQILKKKK